MLDGAALGLLLGAISLEDDGGIPVATLGLATYALGPPIVHFARGSVARGFGSLGLRVATPILFGVIGASLEDCSGAEFFCGASGAAVGVLLGVGGAITLDAALLSYDDPPDPASNGLGWAPTLFVTGKRWELGVAGRF